MRREKLEHLGSAGMIEGKCSKGKRREKIFDELTKWLKVGRVTEALSVRDAWKVMIAYSNEHGT